MNGAPHQHYLKNHFISLNNHAAKHHIILNKRIRCKAMNISKESEAEKDATNETKCTNNIQNCNNRKAQMLSKG